MQHGGGSAFAGARVALEAFLPLPATCVGHGGVVRCDKVMTVVAHVAFFLQLVTVHFLQEVNRAICRRDVPADLGILFHVVTQESPQGLAEDHVLKVGDLGEDFFGKGVRDGTHEERMLGLAVDGALENVIPLDSDRHQEKLRWELTLPSWTKSPLLA